MSTAAVVHPGPYTVEDLYALPDDGARHELVDGALIVTPPPAVPHQLTAKRLVEVLSAAAPDDVEVLEAVGVELPAGVLIPDVVVAVASAVYAGPRLLSPADVRAVVEIVSPSSRRADRSWKPDAYAEAGIPVFWRVDPDAPGGLEIVVFVLAAGAWRETARCRAGEETTLDAPYPLAVDPATLTGPARG